MHVNICIYIYVYIYTRNNYIPIDRLQQLQYRLQQLYFRK